MVVNCPLDFFSYLREPLALVLTGLPKLFLRAHSRLESHTANFVPALEHTSSSVSRAL